MTTLSAPFVMSGVTEEDRRKLVVVVDQPDIILKLFSRSF